MRLLTILLLTLMPTLTFADGDVRKGLYSVLVQPVNPEAPSIETQICWQGASKPNTPLGPLGRGPLSDCPSQARATEGGTEVITQCPGQDGMSVLTRYRVTSTGFRGWVSIQQDRNTILVEKQTGAWLGRC